MISSASTRFLLTCGLGLGLGLAAPLPAGVPANPPAASLRSVATNLTPEPPMPTLKSPVDTFRELLAMRLAGRKQFLTNRPPETQKAILAKVREYESLKPDERELRLRATELRWHLQPLMNLPATNRVARLALLPAELRRLVEDRLKQWDLLTPEAQQELLNNEVTARYFAQLEAAASEEQRQKILNQVSPERRAKLQAGIDRWRGLSEEQRRKTLDRFNAFFELTPQEKETALNTLSEAERRQMEKVLESYAKLAPSQRVQCIRSFEKFTGMSAAERLQFLKNAERWQRMSPAERATWRNLVSVAPLIPPARMTPPLPRLVPRRPPPPVATN